MRIAETVKRPLLLTYLFTIVTGCFVPRQPALTAIEKSYFERLSLECSCQVTREIDGGLILNTKSKGCYFIKFHDLSYGDIGDTSFLGAKSHDIAQFVSKKILNGTDVYNRITIVYSYKTHENEFRDFNFDYAVDTIR